MEYEPATLNDLLDWLGRNGYDDVKNDLQKAESSKEYATKIDFEKNLPETIRMSDILGDICLWHLTDVGKNRYYEAFERLCIMEK